MALEDGSGLKYHDAVELEFDKPKRKPWLRIIIGIVVVGLLIGLTGYFYMTYRRTQKLLSNPQEAAKLETAETVKKVQALIELDTDEEPTVAVVSDAGKLKDKPFFAQAQNGDRVIVYSQTKKAILYRPSTNKIVEMAPVALPDATDPVVSSPSATPSVEPVTPVTVSILNGTDVAGLAARAEGLLSDKANRYAVGSTGNAQRQSYQNTIVVDMSGTKMQEANELAGLFGGTVGDLPSGEQKGTSDLVVILGKDYADR